MNSGKMIILAILLCLSIVQAKDIPSKILMTSIPKTGTMMLSKLVRELTGLQPRGSSSVLTKEDIDLPPDTFLMSHAPALEENLKLLSGKNFKTLVLLRDPRDVIISMYYYFGPKHAKKLGLDHVADKDKIIMLHITKWYLTTDKDSPSGPYLEGDYHQFFDWSKQPDVFFTTYEALVGSKGGGSDELQKKEISAIADFLGIALTQEELTTIATNLYGGTATFRNGGIGSWRNHFTPEHVAAFKEYAGELLIKMGYEKDNNWGI